MNKTIFQIECLDVAPEPEIHFRASMSEPPEAPVVYCDMPEVGKVYESGEVPFEAETDKTSFYFEAGCKLKVTAVNAEWEQHPEQWIFEYEVMR